MPTDKYFVYRVCETFPNWVTCPLDYYELSHEDQQALMAYVIIRDAEELEIQWLKSQA